ncbi:MAG: T9SS type A sorting domain-containing protein, partial [Cryomorphaceae bacterium]|nr:T9SS type A sorting domain-containing protein [Cryomorphaceae bacterium]
IRTSVYADPIKFFTNQQFEDNLNSNINVPGTPGGSMIPGLKSFINNRRNSVAPQVSSFCILQSEEHVKNELNIFPNPVNEELHVELNSDEAMNIEIVDMAGKVLFKQLFLPGLPVSTSHLKNGMYILMVPEKNLSIPFSVVH